MNITDRLVAGLTLYGLPALCGVILAASIGVPLLPVSFMLIVAGSFAKQGNLKLAHVLIAATATAILGDHIAYGLSRWGGRRLIDRITVRMGGAAKIKKAEEISRRWGAVGIFFSRWLVTELCPWVSVASGLTRYPYGRFLFLVVTGEVLWVGLYVMVGYASSLRARYLAEVLGYHSRVILGLIVALILGWKIMRYLRPRLASKKVTLD
jgi:membrane-associated protein